MNNLADLPTRVMLARADAVASSTSSAAGALATVAPPGVFSGLDPTQFDTGNPITLFIIQLVIIIAFTQTLGWAFKFIRQPRVIAEVIGGVILGPTVFGRIPGFSSHIFPPVSLPYLNLISNVGLVLFLFLVGMEVDLSVIRKNYKAGIAISATGMVIPFGVGAALAVAIYNEFINTEKVSFGHFLLFTGVAISITAFPVLCRILTETKLLETKVGQIVLSAGVGNDVVGWILLALTIALVNGAVAEGGSSSSGVTAVYILLAAVGWTILLLWPGKKAFLWLCRRSGSFEGEHGPTPGVMIIMLMAVFVSAFFTQVIGVHAIFGGFLVGLIIPHQSGFARKTTEKLDDLVSLIFLPIYFVLSGLKTNLGLLDTGKTWGYTIAIIVVAFVGKFVGCAAAARFTGFNSRESLAIGSLMSCKGLVELIVLNIGLQAGILDTRTFSMFVVMAIFLTFITTPLTLFFYPHKYHQRMSDGKGGEGMSIGGASAFTKTVLGESGVRESTTRFMVVMQKLEHLSAIMLLTQLLEPPTAVRKPASTLSSAMEEKLSRIDSAAEKDVSENQEEGQSVDSHVALPITTPKKPSPTLTIDALRLVELTGRTFSVMQSIETEVMARKDDLLQLYRQFARLRGFNINTSVSVVNQDHFPDSVTNYARDTGAELVIVPWTTPASGASEAMAEEKNEAGPSSVPVTPFEGVFGSDNNGAPLYSSFLRRVFAECPTDVALFVDRGFAATDDTSGGGQHIFFPFFGGPDDRTALSLVVQLCHQPNITATVLRLESDIAPASPTNDASVPATGPVMGHSRARNASTSSKPVYGNLEEEILAHQNAMQMITLTAKPAKLNTAASAVADETAWNYFSSPHTIKPAHLQSALSRISFSSIPSTSPLQTIIQHATASVTATSSSSWRPLLIVVGRGRKSAGQTGGPNSKELARMLSIQGLNPGVGAEMRKTVGDTTTAFIISGTKAATASFLVVQAGEAWSDREEAI